VWVVMSIFVIFRVTDPAKLTAAIATNFENEHLELGNNEWLVSSNMTPQGISDKLGTTDGSNGAAIVFGMSGYFGRAPSNIWDWIKSKAEQANG
jgi:hypothetical protein